MPGRIFIKTGWSGSPGVSPQKIIVSLGVPASTLGCLTWILLSVVFGIIIGIFGLGQGKIQETFCSGQGMINGNLTCSCFSGFRGPDCSLSEREE